MGEMTGFNDKLYLFNGEAARINKELSQFLTYSETLLTEMLDKIPGHDYSIDASKELSQQSQDIKDKIRKVSEKMSDIRHDVWKMFYERQKKLLNEYHELYYKSRFLPENSEEEINLNELMKNKIDEVDIYERLQNCWGEYFGDQH